MFSVNNIVQNVKLIELWGKNYILSPLKANFCDFPIGHNVKVRVVQIQTIMTN